MTAAFRRLVALTDVPRSRVALSVLLGAATVVFGAGLMATAGYLISRAAEQPPILSLTVAIVAVRFFGLARPLARYLERLVSHDLAFRALARVRVGAYERIEPLAPAELEGYRRGDLLSRLVADVDSLQNLHLRGFHPLLVAAVSGAVCVGVTAAFLPAAALVLACGLLLAGVAVPLVSGSAGEVGGRAAGRRPRPAGGRAGRAACRRRRSWSSTGGSATGSRACAQPTACSYASADATRSPPASATAFSSAPSAPPWPASSGCPSRRTRRGGSTGC